MSTATATMSDSAFNDLLRNSGATPNGSGGFSITGGLEALAVFTDGLADGIDSSADSLSKIVSASTRAAEVAFPSFGLDRAAARMKFDEEVRSFEAAAAIQVAQMRAEKARWERDGLSQLLGGYVSQVNMGMKTNTGVTLKKALKAAVIATGIILVVAGVFYAVKYFAGSTTITPVEGSEMGGVTPIAAY